MKLWIELLAGPIAWFVNLCVLFAVAPWSCTLGWKPALYGISAAALLVCAASAWMAWNDWRRLGRDYPGEAAGTIAASRAMASGGVLLNGLFAIVVVAQFVVTAGLGACE